MKALAAVIGIGLAFNLGMLAGDALAFKPELVAFGCAGANGPIFAMEESDLPPCQAIEPYEVLTNGPPPQRNP